MMRQSELPIRKPCHEDWERMQGSERERHCLRCERKVHDLSTMTEPEVRLLLRERPPEGICVRYRANADGVIQLRRPLPGPARALALGVALSVAACEPGEIGVAHSRSAPAEPTVAVAPVVVGPKIDPARVEPSPLPAVAPTPDTSKSAKATRAKGLRQVDGRGFNPRDHVMGMF